MYQTLQEMIHPIVGKMRLGMDLETDLSDLPVDEPIPEDRIPRNANFHKAYFDHIVGMIREGLTLRQLYLRYERGNKTFRGTPAQMADAYGGMVHHRRLRRLHDDLQPDARRPRRLRRWRRPAAAAARPVPHRLRGHHAARASRPARPPNRHVPAARP